ncbi:MAG: hypothetical protein RIR26_2758 [Pseudomonadota bacterium]
MKCSLKSTWRSLLAVAFVAAGLARSEAQAVPQLFLQEPSGQQADVTWARLENERFIIYYDATQPSLGDHALKALEKAYSDYSLLLGTVLKGQPVPPHITEEDIAVSKFNKIPVIISSRSDGASFANFIPQTLEIQSSTRPPASLFQHELAHRMMYEHIDLGVGPAGRTFMLAMLPTWWTEGLPEYLTESLGRLETEGYLRAMALNNSFLSWDRMHALYKAAGDTSLLGYATAGRFFKYFLERAHDTNLKTLHEGLKYKQLIPPFFTGAYFLIKDLTGHWPEDLYDSFKKDLKTETFKYLEGMPQLKNMTGASRIFSNFDRGSYLLQDKSILIPSFSNSARRGGVEVYKFYDPRFKKPEKSFLLPLELESINLMAAHRMDMVNGGFWTAVRERTENRTWGDSVVYQTFNGPLNQISDEKISEQNSFSMSSEGKPAVIREISAIAPKTAAVLSTRDTSSFLDIIQADIKKKTRLASWVTPASVRIVRPHDAYLQSESSECVTVLVDRDFELTSLERHCADKEPEVIIPSGTLTLRDGVMVAPDDYFLLVGWHDVQALIHWEKGQTTLIAGLPDWVESIAPGENTDSLMLTVFTGSARELWRVHVNQLRSSHLAWMTTLSEVSRWQTQPVFHPYQPPFEVLAQQLRRSKPTASANTTATDTTESPETTDAPEQQDQTPPPATTAVTTVPAPYRFKHWMTYPNFTPSFLAGVTTLGVFSRPLVDEMERFYVQFFGSYVWDTTLKESDRWGLEANLIGNRVFDGWKANVFLRPRFNGLAYAFRCTLPSDSTVYLCPENRQSTKTQFYSYAFLREWGSDFQFNRRSDALSSDLSVRSKIFKISPSSTNNFIADKPLGAQDTALVSLGGTAETSLWKKVFFTAPVSDLNKEEIPAGASIRMSVDTTHSLNEAKSGSGKKLPPVGFQNYSVEISHSAVYGNQSFGIRNSYSSTGGGSPLNLQEFFRPFKTYLIGANDGLQDISTSLSGNGLLGYSLVGRAQYRNSLNYTFPIVRSIDTRLGLAYLERLEGELVLSRGGVSDRYDLKRTESITTLTGSMRLNIDIKGYGFYPAILYGHAIDKPLWQLFTQIRFDQFW